MADEELSAVRAARDRYLWQLVKINEILHPETSPEMTIASVKLLRCSFCAKDTEHVRKLIAGPNAWICDECVDVCREIVAADDAADKSAKTVDAVDPVGEQVTE